MGAPGEPNMHITEAPRTFYFSGKSGILGPNAVLPRRRAHPFPSKPSFGHVFFSFWVLFWEPPRGDWEANVHFNEARRFRIQLRIHALFHVLLDTTDV